ncbi:putative sensor histidine kinase TcrY [bioreactor metagenome]|uniref:histidine kinase n=1 Tax=bioreactor metagenome TaxID=1076179 RepID=A0A645AA43_9ZZZZ
MVTTIVAQRVLMRQLDDRLAGVLTRQQNAVNNPGQGYPGGVDLPGQPIGTVVVVVPPTKIAQQGMLTPEGIRPVPSEAALVALSAVAPDSGAHSLVLDQLGPYRAMAVTDHRDVVVVGLPLTETRSAVIKLVWTVAILSVLATAASVITVYVVVVRKTRPLTDLAAVAREVSAMPLEHGNVDLGLRVPAPRYAHAAEVAEVGDAFNQMLGHVESALQARQISESKVRRFVADASHELRTPLAAIRGYAELTRRGRATMPAQIAHFLDRIDAEAERMSGLVEDLLLLARLENQVAPEVEPVDLTEIVVNAVTDAQAAGPDHRWSLDVPTDPVTVIGDHRRLHQVVANLLANARTHTPPGTRVMTRVTVAAAPPMIGTQARTAAFGEPSPGTVREAVLTVHDNGPGIPNAMIKQVFDRFVRADSSRARIRDASAAHNGGSTGLGLSIVAAVVAAHGGQVTVTSRCAEDLSGPAAQHPDTWTTFTVRLPLAPVPRPTPA